MIRIKVITPMHEVKKVPDSPGSISANDKNIVKAININSAKKSVAIVFIRGRKGQSNPKRCCTGTIKSK